MTFLRTHSGELIALADISKIAVVEHPGGGHTIVATLRSDGTIIKLARDYSLDALSRALDPTRSGR